MTHFAEENNEVGRRRKCNKEQGRFGKMAPREMECNDKYSWYDGPAFKNDDNQLHKTSRYQHRIDKDPTLIIWYAIVDSAVSKKGF